MPPPPLRNIPNEVIELIFKFLLVEEVPITTGFLGSHNNGCLAIFRASKWALKQSRPIFYGSNTFDFWGNEMLRKLNSTKVQPLIRHITVGVPYPDIDQYLRLIELCLELRSLNIILHNDSGEQLQPSFHYFSRPKELRLLTIVFKDISLKEHCAKLILQLEKNTFAPRRSLRKTGILSGRSMGASVCRLRSYS